MQVCTTRRPTQVRPLSRARPLQQFRSLPPLAGTPGTLLCLEDPQKDSLVASRLSPLGALTETISSRRHSAARRLSPQGDLRKMNLQREVSKDIPFTRVKTKLLRETIRHQHRIFDSRLLEDVFPITINFKIGLRCRIHRDHGRNKNVMNQWKELSNSSEGIT